MAARRHTGGSLRDGVVAASVGGSSLGASEVCAARLACSRAARRPEVLSAGGRACVCSVEALQRRIRRALRAPTRVPSQNPNPKTRGSGR